MLATLLSTTNKTLIADRQIRTEQRRQDRQEIPRTEQGTVIDTSAETNQDPHNQTKNGGPLSLLGLQIIHPSSDCPTCLTGRQTDSTPTGHLACPRAGPNHQIT